MLEAKRQFATIGGITLKKYSQFALQMSQTDAVVWVVDSGDVDRLEDCKREFNELIFEEVITFE